MQVVFETHRPRIIGKHLEDLELASDPNKMGQKLEFSEKMSALRIDSIRRWYEEGGQWFLNWTKENYRKWSGEKLHWNEAFAEEYYLLLGNPWFQRIVVEKAAQVGMTESFIAFTAFVLSAVRVSLGYGFEREKKLRDVVGPRIQPAFTYIQPVQEIKMDYRTSVGREDIDSKDRKITVGGTEATFFYTKTNETAKNGPERQASSGMSSFTAWVILLDEAELMPPGAIDIATERQSACEMPTKPMRIGSTPGHEGGVVDTQVKLSENVFMWRVDCPHCGHRQFIHPFGNFLRSVVVEEDGIKEERFVDLTGRPMKWFCCDDTNRETKIKTAYVGCQECEKELTQEHLDTGHFYCIKTGVSLTELCDQALKNQSPIFSTVALRLPRLASKLFNPAERIRKLIETRNPIDAIQQGLGLAINVGGGKISLTRLNRCVNASLPERFAGKAPGLVVIGMDQGRAAHWGMVQHWYFEEQNKDPEQKWLNAHKVVVWWGEVIGFDGLEDLSRKHNADLIGFDADPEIQVATDFARKHSPTKVAKGKAYPMDQVMLKGEDFKFSTRNVQNQEVPVVAIHRTAGLDAVRQRILLNQQYFPEGTHYDPKDEGNLFLHYMSSERTSEGIWTEPAGLPDHLFHADNFCEMVVLCHFFAPKPKRLVFSSVST